MIRIFALLLLSIALCPAAKAAAAPAERAEAVVLGPLDQIEVNIDNYPTLKTITRVGADGAVILPLIDRVRIAGMTPADAANEIETRYVNGGFIKLPTVRLEIIDYQSRKVSVLGSVNNQGLIALDRTYSFAEIIARAGGLSNDAGSTAVVTRQKPGGGSERITVDIGQIAVASDARVLEPVRAGDVVFVPKAPTISVVGAVNHAGTYPLVPGMTVDQALAAAGDISSFGTRSRLRIRRAVPAGGPVTVIETGPDAALQPGDILVVRERLL